MESIDVIHLTRKSQFDFTVKEITINDLLKSKKEIPSFQRSSEDWLKSKKIKYIMAIYENSIPTPMVYNRKNKNILRCLDGLQRITAISNYVDGYFDIDGNRKFLILSKNTFFNNKSIQGKFDDLDEDIKKIFLETKIKYNEYNNIGEEDEKEIFIGVNSGVALTNTQLLCAAYPQAKKFCEKFIKDLPEFFKSIKKQRDKQIALAARLLLNHYDSSSIITSNIDKFFKEEDIHINYPDNKYEESIKNINIITELSKVSINVNSKHQNLNIMRINDIDYVLMHLNKSQISKFIKNKEIIKKVIIDYYGKETRGRAGDSTALIEERRNKILKEIIKKLGSTE